MKSKNSTTRLPQSLLEKLREEQEDPRFNTSGHKRRGVSRKQLRQKARNTKKERKAANNVNHKHRQQQVASADNAETPPVPISVLKPAISTTKRTAEDGPQPSRKKQKVSFDVSSKSSTHVSRLEQEITSAHKSSSNGPRKSASKSANSEEINNPRSRPSKDLIFKDRAELEEERKINWLEKQLGLSSKGASRSKGRNKYSGEFEEDGLDDLLTSLDRIIDRTPSSNVGPPSLVMSDDGEADHFPSSSEDILDSVRAGSEESGDDLSIMNDGGPLSDDISESSGDENGNHDSDNLPTTVPLETGNNPETKESGARYIPPHLRSRTDQRNAEVSAEIIKLKRQLKGLLNRVSEQNMGTVLDDILALYRNNRRNDVTTTITDLLIDSISSHSQLLDSFVILHATLVASLHKLIGIDFAAHFVQESIACFENKYKLAISAPEVANKPIDEVVDQSENPDFDFTSIYSKESSNLIVLISELYNFQVISCVLVYDIIRLLLDGDNLTEISVELVLKIARNSGSQLRSDDPLALKDITELVLKKAGDGTRGMRQLSSRTRFMIDTLTNLKSGKSKSQTKGHAPGGDSIQRLRKFLTGLEKKRHVIAREPLNVSLADLHSSEKRGKWWLVGAAWAGDPLVEAQKQREGQSADQVASSTKRGSRMISTEVSEEAVLLQVARRQGMNTDVRRSIFVLLMSSEDYIDACERIRQLPLRDVQQGEIVRVLLHCCGNEKVYNPYYAMVGQQLAHTSQSSHRFAILLQFCLWDFLRGIGEDEVGGAGVLQNARDNGVTSEGSKDTPLVKIQNVASAYAWWTCRGIAALSILKAVDFTNLKPQGEEFFKTFFIQLFLGIQTHSPVTSYHSSKPPNVPEEKDVTVLADLFFKVAGQSTLLAQGLHYYFRQCHLESEVKSEELKRLLEWSVDAAMRHLKEGLEAPAS